MRYLKIICTAFLIFPIYGSLSAQFSIPTIEPSAPIVIEPVTDTVRTLPTLRNDFFSQARRDAERRALRKERNTIEFNAKLDLSQTQMENWASGGDNTFSTLTSLYFRHIHQRKKFGFAYFLDTRLGYNRIRKKNYKNNDYLRLNLETSWKMTDRWSYSAQSDMRTQYLPGYKYDVPIKDAGGTTIGKEDKKITDFMSPGVLELTVGFKYRIPSLEIDISPIGGKGTFILDEYLRENGADGKKINGVPIGDRAMWEIGPALRMIYNKVFYKDMFRFRAELNSFFNPKKAPTVRLDSMLEIRPMRWLTTTLRFETTYNKEDVTPIPDRIQLRYSIGIGLAYTFKNK